jgi:tetratricopeptide (TPR) repeat protein
MRKLVLSCCAIVSTVVITAQTNTSKPEILYGAVQQTDLQKPPYNKWFDSMYAAYDPSPAVISSINRQELKDIRIDIFFGTWCGDSRREVPRFLKMMDQLAVPASKISLVATGSDSLYKQSPQHEEAGKGIFRVPVFIVYRNGAEIGRINEFPVTSLEKDLATILAGQSYDPNYRSFALVNRWLIDGSLQDKNTNLRGLALQLKYLVAGERELNSLGYVLLEQGKKAAALKLFQVNALLYPESANVLSSLGEGYYENADHHNAVVTLEKAIELNKEPALVKEILKVLYKAKLAKD